MQRLCGRIPVTQQYRRTYFLFRPSAISPVVRKNISPRWAHSSAQAVQLNTHDIIRSNPISTMRESFGNYNLIKRVKLDFTNVVVSKWKSSVTGLTVIHLDYQGNVLLRPVLNFT